MVSYKDPSRDIVEAVRSGQVHVGVYVERPALVVLVRCGVLEWWDLPYSMHLDSEGQRGKAVDVRAVVGLHVVLVDSHTTAVLATRTVTMPSTVARTLHKALVEQSAGAWNQRQFDLAVASLPPAAALASRAIRGVCQP